ncbi:hypothetical protein DL95DRAFT_382182 [Leptodontidium sp. 2 PMI_412]|nr:hypothetical protein DL95DRAFT_382182 [Leptodontidium sp. 2 PMI_412]
MSNDNAIVTHVRVVAHVSQVVGGISENHWSIYLLLEGGRKSVRVNMRARELESSTGILEYDEYNYLLSTSALRHWDYQMVGGVTVGMIKYVIAYQGRSRYEFSGGRFRLSILVLRCPRRS